ncbi:Integrin alpha-V [Varanus komodoensis]|nr:Integrin alpha-V [Varanus komodoensis]
MEKPGANCRPLLPCRDTGKVEQKQPSVLPKGRKSGQGQDLHASDNDAEGQGFCQGGFSIDFTQHSTAKEGSVYRKQNPFRHACRVLIILVALNCSIEESGSFCFHFQITTTFCVFQIQETVINLGYHLFKLLLANSELLEEEEDWDSPTSPTPTGSLAGSPKNPSFLSYPVFLSSLSAIQSTDQPLCKVTEPCSPYTVDKGLSWKDYSLCKAAYSVLIRDKEDRVLLGGPGSFYWQGQLISDQVAEIVSKYNPKIYTTKYDNQLATRSASAAFDDSYLGYSVTVGDFNNDGTEDFVSGVPRAAKTLGLVSIYNGKTMASMYNFTGEQMAAYFGYSVAATDINGDHYVDLFIGAPLFMDRGSDGKLLEVGQVSVYFQQTSGGFQSQVMKLTGFEVFARFSSAIAPLGDLDQDGFNDIAVAAPYGGEDKKGLVYIYNGRATGLNGVPSQVLEGQWASKAMPPSFGYSLKGDTDVDKNGYPDLIVGAFGVDKVALYRARPVITVNAGLEVTPTILNPENKACEENGQKVSCFQVKFCLKADGKGSLPRELTFHVELLLDKLKQKGAIRRALFLYNRQPTHSKNMTVPKGGRMSCEELQAFLRDESEFRDKLTPITIFMEYQLDYKTASDTTGLQPILNQFTPANLSRQAHILLDCGEDNICRPDLKVTVDRICGNSTTFFCAFYEFKEEHYNIGVGQFRAKRGKGYLASCTISIPDGCACDFFSPSEVSDTYLQLQT